jgi:hypothetical protein
LHRRGEGKPGNLTEGREGKGKGQKGIFTGANGGNGGNATEGKLEKSTKGEGWEERGKTDFYRRARRERRKGQARKFYKRKQRMKMAGGG